MININPHTILIYLSEATSRKIQLEIKAVNLLKHET